MSKHIDDRRYAIQTARRKLELEPVYLDTETTGLDDDSEIIEISILDFDGTVLLDSLVKPVGYIPEGASAVHGITLETVADAPTWAELWPQVETILDERVLGIYNAEYDIRLMQQSHRLYEMRWQQPAAQSFCIMKLYAQFYGDWNSRYQSYRWQRLEQAGRQCHINLPNSHRAKDDAMLARAVLEFMAAQEG